MDTVENRRFHKLIVNLSPRIQDIVIHNNYNHFRFPCYSCVHYFKFSWVREPICGGCYDGNQFLNFEFDEERYGKQYVCGEDAS